MARMMRAWLFLALALVLAACGAMPTPVVRPTGRPEPAIEKARKPRPAHTAIQTETPEPTDVPPFSATDTPQLVLSPTPLIAGRTPTAQFSLPLSTLTPTILAISSTAIRTPTAAMPLACKLAWQSPPDGSTYSTGDKFSVGWDIKNTGTTTWEPGSFEFVYLGGAKLATHDDVIPLKESVPPGQDVVLSVPLKAPLTPNKYTTHWGIRQGQTYFCRLTLTIWVQVQ